MPCWRKTREGYLINANTLPFFARGNASFAASAYKNITSRLSVSADLGLSFGHVTSNSVEISQTQSKTFNLLAAAIYYHLLPASYRLQPYVSVGINDIINDASYVTVPIGIGAKFNSKKSHAVLNASRVTTGAGHQRKNIAIRPCIPWVYISCVINNKKHKQLDNDDNKPYNRPDKDDAKKKDKDTTAGRRDHGDNVNVTINMDSVLKAKGLLNDDGSPRLRGDNDGQYASDGSDGSGHGKKRRGGLHNFDVNDFEDNEYKKDSLDGRPIIRNDV